jgi:hypothetical protein
MQKGEEENSDQGKDKAGKEGKTLRKLKKLEANKPLIVAKYSP